MARRRSKVDLPCFDDFEEVPPSERMVGGTQPKSLLVDKSTGDTYIAKSSKSKADPALACLTEFLIHLAGKMLSCELAEGGLCLYHGEVHFFSRYFLEAGEDLLHGVELFSQLYSPDHVAEVTGARESEQALYTVRAVKDVLGAHFLEHEDQLFAQFVSLLTHDAIIGAMDRHAENWGVIVRRTGESKPRIAPIYDSASALFWHHDEESLLRKFVRNPDWKPRLQSYVERSFPLIGWDDCKELNHVALITRVFFEYPELRQRIRQMLGCFDRLRFTDMALSQVGGWVTPMRIDLIGRCINLRIKAIRKSIENACVKGLR